MTSIDTQRAQVLAEAVVSTYVNELAARERAARRPAPEGTLARLPRRERVQPRAVPVAA